MTSLSTTTSVTPSRVAPIISVDMTPATFDEGGGTLTALTDKTVVSGEATTFPSLLNWYHPLPSSLVMRQGQMVIRSI